MTIRSLIARASTLVLVPALLSVVACSSAEDPGPAEDNLIQDAEVSADADRLGLDQNDVVNAAKRFSPRAVSGDSSCSIAAAAGTLAVASAAVMELSAGATVTCGGVMAVTGAGELLCLVPAAGTALSGLTAAVAGVAAGAATIVCTGELAGIKIRRLAEDLAGTISSWPIGCSPGDYLMRTAAKYYFCKLSGPSSCSRSMSCADLAARSATANGCMVARLVHNACFPGNGDATHKEELRKAIANVNACNVALASCR